ncbi:MAG: GGDEF domain-containing protein [Polyangiaceae bacterium]|nr:GGDEF domain-containing protein [Polyangiaceae bacterium]
MMEFHRGEATFLRSCLQSFSEHFETTIVDVLRRELRGIQPASVTELREQLQLLMRQLESRGATVQVHEAMAGLLRRVLMTQRRRVAESLEIPLAKAVDPQVVGALHREVRRFEDLLSADWCTAARPQPIPKLTDFLSIRFAAEAMAGAPALEARAYDEKFHVLEAPRLFFPDLAHFRHECELRTADLVVVYVDIDDFKAVNAKLTETVVDLKVLTPFLEIIEAWAFARAHAYRFGGDEYVLLVPNAGRALAETLLGELRRRITSAVFSGTDIHLSVSMGACVVDPDCPLTDREILGRANLAKSRAKAEKKGSIVLVEPPEYRPDSAEVV